MTTSVSVRRTDPDATHVAVDGRGLRLSDVVAVARRRGRAHVTIPDDAAARIDASNGLKHRLIDTQQPIYGVTTGFGDRCTQQIAPDNAAELQRNLIRYHLNGEGPPAADDVVRATLLIRANCLARGVSGVRRTVAGQLLAFLDHDILPLIPERGSLGASGDLVPLCYLSTALVGEGEVRHRGRRRHAADAIVDAGLRPLDLEPKEALALINGTSFMAAFAVLAANDAAELAFVADLCAALTSEVLEGNRSHYAAFVHDQKPHRGQVASAALIHRLLSDSQLSREHSQIIALSDELGDRDTQELVRHIQDRYSVRCSPHITGVLRDTLQWVVQWLHVEVNSATDNPLFDLGGDTVHSGGNFYGGHVAQAMDALKVAVASTADHLDRQLALIVDDKFSHGLTPNLVAPDLLDGPDAGLHHGYKGMQIACSALAAEALKEAAPASVFSRSTEAHNQDKVSMGAIAARDARTVVALAVHVAAMHLHALMQAADLRGHERLGSRTRAAHAFVRRSVPFLEADRRLDGEVDTIADAVRSGALRRAVDPDAARTALDGLDADGR